MYSSFQQHGSGCAEAVALTSMEAGKDEMDEKKDEVACSLLHRSFAAPEITGKAGSGCGWSGLHRYGPMGCHGPQPYDIVDIVLGAVCLGQQSSAGAVATVDCA